MASNSSPLHTVGFVHEREGGSTRYRCIHAMEQLELFGIHSHLTSVGQRDAIEILDGCGTVIFHRAPVDQRLERLYRRIRANGGAILFDTDDLVFDRASYTRVASMIFGDDPEIMMSLTEEVSGYRRAMYSSDALIVSTSYLRDEAAWIAKPINVHRNAFSLEMLKSSDNAIMKARVWKDSGKVIIGYASGTPTHDRDFSSIRRAIKRLLDKYPRTELWIVGFISPDDYWGSCSDRVRHIGFMSWQDLPSVIARFDINLAPLEMGLPFSEAKSELKYIEAGLVGVPTVASNTDSFRFAITSGENGILAATEGEWSIALESLVCDSGFRNELGERARSDVLQRYDPKVRGANLISILESAIGHRIL